MLATTVATRRTGGEGPVGMNGVEGGLSTLSGATLWTPSTLPVSDAMDSGMGYLQSKLAPRPPPHRVGR